VAKKARTTSLAVGSLSMKSLMSSSVITKVSGCSMSPCSLMSVILDSSKKGRSVSRTISTYGLWNCSKVRSRTRSKRVVTTLVPGIRASTINWWIGDGSASNRRNASWMALSNSGRS